jgi:uncharacterized protein YqgV (UPF0045/DUF77 family)
MYPPSLSSVSPAPRRLRQVTVGLSLVVALWKTEAMLVAFSVAPSGVPTAGPAPHDASVHDAVAEAVRVVRESGLPNRTDAMFTTIEGEWDEVMDVVKRATEAVGRYGSRVSLVLKADIRPGYYGELTGKVDRLEAAITEREQQ